MQRQELVGEFGQIKFSWNGGTIVGLLANGDCVIGKAKPEDLTPGLQYRFMGMWKKHPKFGMQFAFSSFAQQSPKTRNAVVAYLKRMALPGIGEITAHKLVDKYGAEKALETLRCSPESVSQDLKVPLDKMRAASNILSTSIALQETKVELLSILDGKGFHAETLTKCIQIWGAAAPDVIRRDPYKMLTHNIPGCGFLRVDRLYKELGHPPDRLKRQAICAWYVLHSDTSGSTWVRWEHVSARMGALIDGNIRIEKALKLIVRARWIKLRKEEGVRWLAERRRAENEEMVRLCLTGGVV